MISNVVICKLARRPRLAAPGQDANIVNQYRCIEDRTQKSVLLQILIFFFFKENAEAFIVTFRFCSSLNYNFINEIIEILLKYQCLTINYSLSDLLCLKKNAKRNCNYIFAGKCIFSHRGLLR